MGSPDQFADLLEAAYEHGCSACAILLPGHGGTSRDFGQHGLADWQGHLQDVLDIYNGTYPNIILAGHSMGGLLALNASLQEQNHICGVFLLSSPLKINLSPRSLFMRLKLLLYPSRHPVKSAYWQAKSLTNFAVSPRWLKPLRDLWRLERGMALDLPRVFVPVLAIHSRNDEAVSFRSADMFHNGLHNSAVKSITLEKSWHAYYPTEEWEVVRAAFLEFIDKCIKNS